MKNYIQLLREVSDTIRMGRLIECTAEEYPQYRNALQIFAKQSIDNNQHVHARIALSEVYRLDRTPGYGILRDSVVISTLYKEKTMEHILTLTQREMKEVLHALLYERYCNHGTTGHNQLLLIAKMAQYIGMDLASDEQGSQDVFLPSKVRIEEEVKTGHGSTG